MINWYGVFTLLCSVFTWCSVFTMCNMFTDVKCCVFTVLYIQKEVKYMLDMFTWVHIRSCSWQWCMVKCFQSSYVCVHVMCVHISEVKFVNSGAFTCVRCRCVMFTMQSEITLKYDHNSGVRCIYFKIKVNSVQLLCSCVHSVKFNHRSDVCVHKDIVFTERCMCSQLWCSCVHSIVFTFVLFSMFTLWCCVFIVKWLDVFTFLSCFHNSVMLCVQNICVCFHNSGVLCSVFKLHSVFTIVLCSLCCVFTADLCMFIFVCVHSCVHIQCNVFTFPCCFHNIVMLCVQIVVYCFHNSGVVFTILLYSVFKLHSVFTIVCFQSSSVMCSVFTSSCVSSGVVAFKKLCCVFTVLLCMFIFVCVHSCVHIQCNVFTFPCCFHNIVMLCVQIVVYCFHNSGVVFTILLYSVFKLHSVFTIVCFQSSSVMCSVFTSSCVSSGVVAFKKLCCVFAIMWCCVFTRCCVFTICSCARRSDVLKCDHNSEVLHVNIRGQCSVLTVKYVYSSWLRVFTCSLFTCFHSEDLCSCFHTSGVCVHSGCVLCNVFTEVCSAFTEALCRRCSVFTGWCSVLTRGMCSQKCVHIDVLNVLIRVVMCIHNRASRGANIDQQSFELR
ncbi:hypothetical protein DPMN_124039 [Dreissena polymorpha]|uniref:Uncharacterized protein n=1 Tax=Dreissena polymorpha TaxID=45954 RepID=A0A9D4GSI0_DREPO|nr:hypothetical protein DPMN_124039 [Dreissena polymorpha]